MDSFQCIDFHGICPEILRSIKALLQSIFINDYKTDVRQQQKIFKKKEKNNNFQTELN